MILEFLKKIKCFVEQNGKKSAKVGRDSESRMLSVGDEVVHSRFYL